MSLHLAQSQYVFISNVDNLGATVDLKLLYHIVDSEADFAMEVISRSRADTDGGLLAGYDDRPRLVELSQIPEGKRDDIWRRLPLFNTNNIWVNLRAMQRLVARDELRLDLVVHERTVDGFKTIQLETLAGSAMRCFDKVIAPVVPRSRYLPVKSTSDLFLVQSNLYSVKVKCLSTLSTAPHHPT